MTSDYKKETKIISNFEERDHRERDKWSLAKQYPETQD